MNTFQPISAGFILFSVAQFSPVHQAFANAPAQPGGSSVPEQLAAPTTPPAESIRTQIVPISASLGLFDITVETQTKPARVDFAISPSGQSGSARFPLTPHNGPNDQSSPATIRWSGRGMADAVHVANAEGWQGTIILTDADGSEALIPVGLLPSLTPELEIPAWTLGTTWYQIFPERFRNGSQDNDPRAPQTALVPWTSDFADVQIEEIELSWSRARANVRRHRTNMNTQGGARRATIYHRRYGGDLLGVTEKLDHIMALGVESIYFCPIFSSSSLHKYDAKDFWHVDPAFGPPEPNTLARSISSESSPQGDTPADRYFLQTFLPAARDANLRVVLDGVWNHTGTDFWAFEHLARHGRSSPYAEWFRSRFDDQGELIGWTGWDRENGNLPEFIQTPDGDLAPPVKEYIFNVTRRWMDPNGDGDPSDGIDGWRLDVAAEVGMTFWTSWRTHVRSINPEATLIGEIWFDAGPWFNGNAFDSQMNYPFAMPVIEWIGGSPTMTSGRLANRLERVFSHAPHHDLAQMNLLVSHDTARLVTMVQYPTPSYDDGNSAAAIGHRSIYTRPPEEAYKRSLLGVAIQATYLGSPMIYAGDELGMFGPDDPDNRKPLSWPDLGQWDNPDDAPIPEILAAYQRWFTLRQNPVWGPVLKYGSVEHHPSESADVLLYTRTLNGRSLLVAANRSESPFVVPKLGGPLSQFDTFTLSGLEARVIYPLNQTTRENASHGAR